MRFLPNKTMIPWLMTAGRVVLGPILIAGAMSGWSGPAMAGVVVSALLSDVFDGVLARRWQCDSAAVRLFDSMADMAFYLCVAVAMWVAEPGLWFSNRWLALGVVGLELARYGVEFAKYGKPASYHSLLAKTWGLALACGVIAVFVTGRESVWFSVGLGMGILSNAEGLAMSIVLPVWRRDVKTFAAAWRLRRELGELSHARVRSQQGLAFLAGLGA